MKMKMKLHEFISSRSCYRHSKSPTCRCRDLSVHMATTLIENLKKSIIRNFDYFDGIKVKKHFHGNFKVCNFMLFKVFFKCLLRNNYLDSLRSLLSDPRSYVLL